MHKPDVDVIMWDIFGKNVDEGREGGLVDCTSPEDFDQACRAAVAKWSNFEKVDAFIDYFLDGKADDLRESYRADIRSMCGLGYPPRTYNQNANECMNRVIKESNRAKYGSNALGLMEYVNHIQKEVKRQQDEQFLAVIGRGEYKLTKKYSFLHVSEANYYRMTEKQKEDLRNRFFNVSLSLQTTSEQSTSNASGLSVPVGQCQIIDVPYAILKPMFEKAARTATNKACYWNVPASAEGTSRITYMVASHSNVNHTHTVSLNMKSKRVECGKLCANFSAYGICSHCIAVAEIEKCLPEFLAWYRKSKKSPKLTNLVNLNMPTGAGKKASKATQRRKGAANKQTKTIMPSTSRVNLPLMYAPRMMATQPSPWSGSVPFGNVNTGMCSWTSPSQQQHWTNNIGVAAPVRPDPAPGSFVLALLRFTDPRVSKCYGCRGDLKCGSAILPPPGDLVVTSKQYRVFYKDGKQQTSPDMSMVYFHASPACVLLRCPMFDCRMLSVPMDIIPHLTGKHKDLLHHVFNIQL